MNRMNLLAIAIHDPKQLKGLSAGGSAGDAPTEADTPRSAEEFQQMLKEAAHG